MAVTAWAEMRGAAGAATGTLPVVGSEFEPAGARLSSGHGPQLNV